MLLHFIDSTGADPLTPPSVRLRYQQSISNRAVVLWQEGDLVGINAGQDELTWQLSTIEALELSYWHPGGRSPAYAALTLKEQGNNQSQQTIFTYANCQPEMLDWFNPILNFFERLLPGRVATIDQGISD